MAAQGFKGWVRWREAAVGVLRVAAGLRAPDAQLAAPLRAPARKLLAR